MNGTELSQRRSQALATVIVTTVLAPVTADLLFAGLVGAMPDFAAADGRTHGPTETGFWVAAFLAMFALPFSYVIGGLQAAIGGAGLAAYGWFKGRPPLVLAIGLALAAFLGGEAVGLYDRAPAWRGAFLAMHVIPAVLCWLAIRPMWPAEAA